MCSSAELTVTVAVMDLQVAADQYVMARPTSKILNLSLAAVAAGNASSLW